jgi:acyl carrier protein
MSDARQVHERLERVFRDVFDDDSITLRPETTAADIEGWDSLEHINLFIAVEREFKVKFAAAEILGLADVGEFEAVLRRKLGVSA